MTKSYADACLARANAATDGPWKFKDNCGCCNGQWIYFKSLENEKQYVIEADDFSFSIVKDDAEFIASAREDVPELARRLKKACEALRLQWDLHPLADELEAMPWEK